MNGSETSAASIRAKPTRPTLNKALAFLEDKPLAEITLRDLQRYAAFLDTQARNKLGNPYADKTKQRFIIAVKSLFSFASDMGHITANPAKRLPIPRCKDDRGAKVLTAAEIEKLIAAAKTKRDALILRVLFLSGARVSEVIGLRWKDVQHNPQGGQLALFGKGRKNRTVGISAKLYEELITYREECGKGSQDAVFTSQKDGGKMSRQQIFRVVKKAAKEAAVNWDVSPHWLRHYLPFPTMSRDERCNSGSNWNYRYGGRTVKNSSGSSLPLREVSILTPPPPSSSSCPCAPGPPTDGWPVESSVILIPSSGSYLKTTASYPALILQGDGSRDYPGCEPVPDLSLAEC
jgi:site-specific recombinase XerD